MMWKTLPLTARPHPPALYGHSVSFLSLLLSTTEPTLLDLRCGVVLPMRADKKQMSHYACFVWSRVTVVTLLLANLNEKSVTHSSSGSEKYV